MSTSISKTIVSTITEGTASQIASRTSALTDTTITQHVEDVITVPAGSTDLSLAMDGITAKYLHLEISGGPLTLKLNGSGNTGIPLTPPTGGIAVLDLDGCSVSSLFATNAGTAAVTVKRVFAA